MKRLDRVIMIVLLIGVWALVLKPTTITAHDDNYHNCSLSGELYAYGTGMSMGSVVDMTGVSVMLSEGSVECSH